MNGPRRTPNSSADNIAVNAGSGGGALGVGNSSAPHHQYNNQRKNNNGAPTPLLGMAPALPLVPPHPNSHNHHNHSASVPVNPTNASISINQNGRQHYINALSQSVPHGIQDTFHHSPRFRADR